MSGQDGDAVVAQDLVGVGRGGAVGAFADDAGSDVRRDVGVDGVLHGGGNQHVAVAGEQFFVGDRVAAGEVGELAVLAVVEAGGVDVDAALVVDRRRTCR